MGKRGRIQGAADAAARKIARQRLGPLQGLRVNAGGQKRYVRAVVAFLWWSTIVYGLLPETYEDLDDFYFEFICCAWAEGEPVSLVQDGLSGLQWLLRRRRFFLVHGVY